MAAAILLLPWLLVGCASFHPAPAPPSSILHIDPWTFDGTDGSTIVTRHYVIYTTVADDHWQESFARLMEAALQQYLVVAPGVELTARPMECYLFASRRQWEAFTREKTGADASVYLHITRGGYTVHDWFTAFNIGEAGTFSVAAHEGFHQFAARHFKARIPPFLEEGIACMFENVQWNQGTPQWNLNLNPNRLARLQSLPSGVQLIPLSELVTLHAGQIVDGPPKRIAAFYSESWAFAQFLWSADHQKYRSSLQRLLADAAAGRFDGTTPHPTDAIFWNSASAKPLLERYLDANLPTLDDQFRRHISQLVDEPGDPD